MKKLIMCMVILLSFVGGATAQTYTMKKDGTIAATEKKAGVPDKVVAQRDGVTFYQGKRGGVYYLKTSKKTGKTYKVYVKKED